MSLGNRLLQARKKSGLSQETVAERLGVKRQMIAKWESDETLPDTLQVKRMATIYHVSYNALTTLDIDVKEVQKMIDRMPDKVSENIDWRKAWGKKYPVLLMYQKEVDTSKFTLQIEEMLDELKATYQYNEQDAMLVLKDILAKTYFKRKKQGKS
ncbi:MAG: XRE family transcriptional regulator [Erysipelotrichia bacterium]|nr:XRE family transcriptional regulator [Erysipelotrichia bacterium]NCC54536.1 XRE family transcriptional regulator [Erysipelotrichia bacterium]